MLIVPTGWAVNQFGDLGPEFRHLRWDWTIASGGDFALDVSSSAEAGVEKSAGL